MVSHQHHRGGTPVESLTDPKPGPRLARHPIGRCASGRFRVRVTPYGRPMLYWHGELSSMGIFSHDLANFIDWKHLAQQHTIQQSALQRPRIAFYVLARLPPADYSIETDPDGGETLYRVGACRKVFPRTIRKGIALRGT